jgi:DNA polymerase-3 subunit epsilon
MVDNSHRTLHGALLDARLLAEVYLALTRGQESLVMDLDKPTAEQAAAALIDAKKLHVLRATKEEIVEHEKILDAVDKASKEKGGSLWRKLLSTP